MSDLSDSLFSDVRIDRFTLRFADKALEERFGQFQLSLAIKTIRVVMMLGMLLYGAFGLLDFFIETEAIGYFLAGRFFVVCIALPTSLALSYRKDFPRYAQAVLAACMLSCNLGILLMLVTATGMARETYYAGLILVTIFGSSLVRLHHLTAFGVSATTFFIYLALLLSRHEPETIAVNNAFFLVSAILLGTLTGYLQELLMRRNFIVHEMLTEGRKRAETLRHQAEAASRSKSDFLAIMSHELRTPLNAIIGFSDIIRQQMFGPLGTDKYRDYAEDIHTSGTHLLEIIANILDLSKAEAGNLALDAREVDVCQSVTSWLRLFRELAARQGVRLFVDVPDQRPILDVDERLFKQAITNLVSNAIKFTQQGGQVTLSFVIGADHSVEIRVEDTGIGIAEIDLPRVVQPFEQVESALNRQFGGTGLGLPLTKRIAELHGGRLIITSQLGVGTVASLVFPPSRTVVLDESGELRSAV